MKFKLKNKIIITSLFLIFSFFVSVSKTEAAFIYTKTTEDIGARDVFVIDVMIDTEGTALNAVEGNIILSNKATNIEVRDLSVAGSALNLWPRKPSLSEKGDSISFVGGSPDGILGKNILLFKIVASVPKESRLISGKDILVYANDGKGVPVSALVKADPIAISLPKTKPIDVWRDVISNDNTPPEPFIISLQQDETLYDGKKFINFSTTDLNSGVSFYEVKEGGRELVRTGETYVLVDQKNKNNIIVIAHDNAGNVRISELNIKSKDINWKIVIIWVVVLSIVLKSRKIFRKIKNYAKNR
jgi:hypothetical protein